MKFTLDHDLLALNAKNSATAATIGAGSSIKQMSNDGGITGAVRMTATDDGRLSFIVRSAHGAEYISHASGIVDEAGDVHVKITDLNTVITALGGGSITVETSNERTPDGDPVHLFLENDTTSASIDVYPISRTNEAPIEVTDRGSDPVGSFTVDPDAFVSTWQAGSVAHAPNNYEMAKLMPVYLFGGPGHVGVFGMRKTHVSYAAVAATVDGDFNAVVAADAMNAALNIASSFKGDLDLVQFSCFDGIVTDKRQFFRVQALDEGASELMSLTIPMNPIAEVSDGLKYMSMATNNITGTCVADFSVDASDFIKAMTSAVAMSKLLPEGDPVRELQKVGVDIIKDSGGESVRVTLRSEKKSQGKGEAGENKPFEKELKDVSIEGIGGDHASVEVKFDVAWSYFGELLRAASTSESVHIRVFKPKKDDGRSHVLLLHPNENGWGRDTNGDLTSDINGNFPKEWWGLCIAR